MRTHSSPGRPKEEGKMESAGKSHVNRKPRAASIGLLLVCCVLGGWGLDGSLRAEHGRSLDLFWRELDRGDELIEVESKAKSRGFQTTLEPLQNGEIALILGSEGSLLSWVRPTQIGVLTFSQKHTLDSAYSEYQWLTDDEHGPHIRL